MRALRLDHCRFKLHVLLFSASFAIWLLSGEALHCQELAPANSVLPLGSNPSQSPSTSDRISEKIVLPSSESETVENKISGMTYVALDPRVKKLVDGKEPSSLEELRDLELQQSRVAGAIKKVTVNIQQGAAQGSGVVITADGFILTAAHVAGGPTRKATVVFNDGTRVEALTMGMNRNKDAGLVKIINSSHSPWPYATLGRSADLKIGQWCIGAGHPGGYHPERGAVIRVGRIQRISPNRQDAHTLFTDCALIGGDSGGPLFTLDGKLIGIHSRIGTDVTDNMHVPIDVYRDNWDRMVKNQAWGVLPGFDPPYIGVKGSGRPSDIAVIASVEMGGPAEEADIQAGDTVLSVDGQPVQTFQDLVELIAGYSPGDVIVVRIQRGENVLQRPITVGARKSD